MICPNCSSDIEPVGQDIAPPLVICPECERSLVLTDGALRLATGADTADLSPARRISIGRLRTETLQARRDNPRRT